MLDNIKLCDIFRCSIFGDLKVRTNKEIWEKLEDVLSSAEMGLRISQPRISPDGRFLIFTASQYGQLSFFLPSNDLYLLDLTGGIRKKLELNSDQSDTFHSWSSGGRWIVFTSGRQDGLFAKPYFFYIDSLGNVTKPFILPQEDPSFYETCIDTYNVPEFTKEPINISPQVLAEAAFSEQDTLTAKLDPNVVQNKSAEKRRSPIRIRIPLNRTR